MRPPQVGKCALEVGPRKCAGVLDIGRVLQQRGVGHRGLEPAAEVGEELRQIGVGALQGVPESRHRRAVDVGLGKTGLAVTGRRGHPGAGEGAAPIELLEQPLAREDARDLGGTPFGAHRRPRPTLGHCYAAHRSPSIVAETWFPPGVKNTWKCNLSVTNALVV